MNYYKNEEGVVYAYDDQQVEDGHVQEGLVPMTDEEIEAHINPPVQRSYRRFYGNEKLDLFTMEEQLAVVTATMTDPFVKLMYDRLLGAAFLTYEDAETELGLELLMQKGLLTPERKAAIVETMLAPV